MSMSVQARKKRQHYVPQFLMCNFVAQGKDHVFVLDKKTLQVRDSKPKEVCHEKYFYRVPAEWGNDPDAFENWLCKIEGIASPIINRIIRGHWLNLQSPNEREAVANFIATQMLRSPFQRKMIGLICGRIPEAFAGSPPEHVKRELDDSKRVGIGPVSMVALQEMLNQITSHISCLRWWLMETNGAGFHLGDCPVVRRNATFSFEKGGRIGLANIGIEVLLPLSSRFCLSMMCPEVTKRWAQEDGAFMRAFLNGIPMSITDDEVHRINLLQLVYATRFVISPREDFVVERAFLENAYDHPLSRHFSHALEAQRQLDNDPSLEMIRSSLESGPKPGGDC